MGRGMAFGTEKQRLLSAQEIHWRGVPGAGEYRIFTDWELPGERLQHTECSCMCVFVCARVRWRVRGWIANLRIL